MYSLHMINTSLNPTSETTQPAPGAIWRTVRGYVMFGLACALSPCCTPLLVALGLGLLAGTPAALWIGANQGWVYGGFTLLAAVSAVMAYRWLRNNRASGADL